MTRGMGRPFPPRRDAVEAAGAGGDSTEAGDIVLNYDPGSHHFLPCNDGFALELQRGWSVSHPFRQLGERRGSASP